MANFLFPFVRHRLIFLSHNLLFSCFMEVKTGMDFKASNNCSKNDECSADFTLHFNTFKSSASSPAVCS